MLKASAPSVTVFRDGPLGSKQVRGGHEDWTLMMDEMLLQKETPGSSPSLQAQGHVSTQKDGPPQVKRKV